ncbi:MAG: hypothetical protein EA377_02220 [Phycisphaerales bacterium]|nr:MAG: hypothetical protein EA377_02220 [Phycisphaerales bacterium]
MNWQLVSLAEDQRGDDRTQALARQLIDAKAVEFVSPVFLDEFGMPMVLKQDVLVRFEPHVADEMAEFWLLAVGAGEILDRDWGGMERVYRVRPNTRNAVDVLDIANMLAQLPDVTFAEPDHVFFSRPNALPNDPLFVDQWALHNTGQSIGSPCNSWAGEPGIDIGALDAWAVTEGDPDIIIVVFDDGIQQNHPNINQIGGADFTSEGPGDGGPVNECDNHGTPVGGIISGIKDNGVGIAGVAPNTRVASARVFIQIAPCPPWEDTGGTGSVSGFVAGLEWAEDIGARVTNTSWSAHSSSSALAAKFAETRNSGMVHFSSAGNDSEENLTGPAGFSSVNAVSAINNSGDLASFSNWHPDMDFTAPGVSTVSTDRTAPDGYTSTSNHTCYGGTSAASPYAAAVAALILSANPNLSADQVEQIMRDTAMDLGTPGHNPEFGYGLVRADTALQLMHSCEGYCGSSNPLGNCWCDSSCVNFGDCCVFACADCGSCPDTILVPDEYPTIQAAIDAANDGVEIIVAEGTYNEAIDFHGKAIHLRSDQGWQVTTIDATWFDTSVFTATNGEGPGTIIEGFTITGGIGTEIFGVARGGGLFALNASPTVINCAFQDNTAEEGAAIFANLASVIAVQDTHFCQNDPDDIAGPWDDLGGNKFNDVCPWTPLPPAPPNVQIIDERCDEVTISIPDGAEPFPGIEWHWQGTTCGQTTDIGDDPTFAVTDSGTYYLRALDVDSGFWSASCASITVTVEPCPETIHVPGDFSSISDAIDFANDGVEILIAPGTYTDPLNLQGKSIQLRSSDGPEVTIIDVSGQDVTAIVMTSGEGEGTVIDGFTITGGAGTNGGGMDIRNASPVVRNCIFTQNSAFTGGAIFLRSSNAVIEECVFIDNTASKGGAVRAEFSSEPAFLLSTFISNEASSQGGAIFSSAFCNPSIVACNFEENVAGNGGAISTVFPNGNDGHAQVADSYFCENEPSAIAGSWTDDGGNEFADICDPIIYVPDDYPTITDAVVAAQDGMEIVVAPGTYHETVSFMGKAIHIRSSDGPEVTFIDAEFSNAVRFISGEGPDSILEGFTIAGTEGSGMLMLGSSPTVINCIFIGNHAPSWGGAIYSFGSGEVTHPTIIDCVFEGNSAELGGAMLHTQSEPIVIGSVFRFNTATNAGGAMVSAAGEGATVSDSFFCGNSPDDMSGPWIDSGGNEFLDVCPDAIPPNPPAPVIASQQCGQATLSWPDGAAPDDDVSWYWQASGCGESIELGDSSTLTVQQSGMYRLRALNTTYDVWSDGCGSVSVTIEPCPKTIQVPTDVGTITEAIDLIGPSGEIVVAPGTYNEVIDLSGQAFHLRSSGGPEQTIIDGGGLDASVVTATSGEGAGTVMEGFTITGGTGTVDQGETYGGGLLIMDSSPTIRDCILVANTADFGGGAFVNGGTSVFDMCTFDNNTANLGGAMYVTGAIVTVTDGLFVNNSADSGAGISSIFLSSLSIHDSRFENNHAIGGGAIVNAGYSEATITNTAFVENSAEEVAGAVGNGGESVANITNCVFERNTAGDSGGGLFSDEESTSHVAETMFCENEPNAVEGPWSDVGGNEFLDECPDDCGPADLNCDGVVNVFDLLLLLENWGACANPGNCPADLNDDGQVNVFDLLVLLENWG